MRIHGQSQSIDTVSTSNEKTQLNNIQSDLTPQEQLSKNNKSLQNEGQELSKEKLQQAVNTVNEFFEINHTASKFVLHEELNRYFVQLVNTETEEVVKEIPPKKLLDAFYEMQKLVGMIVDEKV